jgi:hypothetical protein
MGPFTVPRIWNGLWQLSSNAWGTASSSEIRAAMERYSRVGYIAYGAYVSIRVFAVLILF